MMDEPITWGDLFWSEVLGYAAVAVGVLVLTILLAIANKWEDWRNRQPDWRNDWEDDR